MFNMENYLFRKVFLDLNNYFSNFPMFCPIIKRAREFHLYDFKGKRYLDLFLAKGSAVLGHGCTGYSLMMKNSIEQALYVAYPNIWEKRLINECSRIFDAYNVQLFSENPRPDVAWLEPWQAYKREDSISYAFWRPGLACPKVEYYALVLPVSCHPAWIILSEKNLSIDPKNALKKSGPISAVSARLLLKALSNWNKADILKTMPNKWCKLFSRFCEVHGRYFFSRLPEIQHAKWYSYACDRGILLPPVPFITGVLPSIMSDGEQKILQEVLEWVE